MGRINAEVDSRSEQEKYDVDFNPRRTTDAGSKSEVATNKYERAGGEDSARPDFVGSRSTAIGGIVRHLIEVDVSQMAAKRKQIKLLQEELVEIQSRNNENKGILEQIENEDSD